MRLPVLLYHHVGPSRPGTFPELTVSAERFARHVSWLVRRGYVGIRPADWLAWCGNHRALPRKPVLLTFDDAYADLTTYALPVLKRHDFGAAVFVVTHHVGGENVWDRLRGSQPHRLMTEDQIREWAGRGIEFGAHSRTHADLTTLSDREVQEEIDGSRDDLAAVTGQHVRAFAYPFGRTNEAVRNRVRAVFDCAFSCEAGLNTVSSDRYALSRSMVQPDDSALALASRVRFGRYPVDRWRARLRFRSRVRAITGQLWGEPR
ncbi:MAG TPA: polysaccharide deacetylase family protein [Vicinamibacterales bacterium]|nr:polysaccharide deacetylase family protein [Vicinamibacterales bacterium]